jgi:hypothetical protein
MGDEEARYLLARQISGAAASTRVVVAGPLGRYEKRLTEPAWCSRTL